MVVDTTLKNRTDYTYYKTNIMGSAPKKPRAMRSKRSGVKKMEQVKRNLEILKKFLTKKG